MQGANHPAQRALKQVREDVVERLTQSFAEDELSPTFGRTIGIAVAFVLVCACGGSNAHRESRVPVPAAAAQIALPPGVACVFNVHPSVEWRRGITPVGIGAAMNVYGFTPTDESYSLRAESVFSPRRNGETATAHRDRLIRTVFRPQATGATLREHSTERSATALEREVEFAVETPAEREFGLFRFELVGSDMIALSAYGGAGSEELRRAYIASLRCRSVPDAPTFDVIRTSEQWGLLMPGHAREVTPISGVVHPGSGGRVGPFARVAAASRSYTSALGRTRYALHVHPIDALEPRDAEAAIVRFALENYGESSRVWHVCDTPHWQHLPIFGVDPATAIESRREVEFLAVGSAVVELVAEYPDDAPTADVIATGYFMTQPDLEELRPAYTPPASSTEPIAPERLAGDLASVRAALRTCTRRLSESSRYAFALNNGGHVIDIRQADDSERNAAVDDCVAGVLQQHVFAVEGRGFMECNAGECHAVDRAVMHELDEIPRCPPRPVP